MPAVEIVMITNSSGRNVLVLFAFFRYIVMDQLSFYIILNDRMTKNIYEY